MSDMYPLFQNKLASHSNHEASLGLTDVARVLASSWRIIGMTGLAALAIAFIVLAVQPRSFRAATTLIYDPPAGLALTSTSRWLEPSADGGMRLDSQVEILRSPSLAKRVIQELRLTGAGALDASPSATGRLNPATDVVPNTPSRSRQEAPGAISREDVEAQVPEFLLRASARRIGGSTAIEISFVSRNAEQAVRIANAIAEYYIQTDLERKAESLKRGSIWLEERLGKLRTDAFEALKKVEEFKRNQHDSTTDAPVRLAELQSSAQTYQSMYERVHLQLMDTVQKINYPVADARIMSTATPSQVSVQPRVKLILAFALAIGLGLGIVASLLRLSQDGRVRNRQDLVKLGIPFAGAISAARTPKRQSSGAALPRLGQSGDEPHVDFASQWIDPQADGPIAIGICGLASGRDVDNSAVLLARWFARRKKRVMIVETRLDWTPASRAFMTGDERGLFDAVTGECAVEALRPIELTQHLSLLPAASASVRQRLASDKPNDIYRDRAFQIAINGIKEKCDVCIFEFAPLSIRPDAGLSGAFLDGMFVVADAGIAEASELAHVVRRLSTSNTFVLGVLLDGTSAFSRARFDRLYLKEASDA